MNCEHQQVPALCDKCAILALVKENAELRKRLKEAYEHDEAMCKSVECWTAMTHKLEKRIADATSYAGINRAQAAHDNHYKYGICDEDMLAAIKAAIWEVEK